MRAFISIFAALILSLTASAQVYVAPEVKISSDKVKVDGNVYYAHVVLEKQTLFSICKAYNVVPQEIYDANKALAIKENGLKAGQIILIPVTDPRAEPVDLSDTDAVAAPEPQPVLFPTEKTEASAYEQPADFVVERADVISLAMILPINSKSSANSSSLDYYSGALIAAKELGEKGVRIDINTFDTADSSTPVTSYALEGSDVIIGPVSAKDISTVLRICPSDKYLISPLDPKAAALADSSRVIQAPVPDDLLVKDLVNWIESDMGPEDAIVVVSESGKAVPSSSRAMLDELVKHGRGYRSITYNILQGLKINASFQNACSTKGTTRFLIASENEAFVGDAIRNINLLRTKEINAILYCTSKVRSFKTIDIEDFYAAEMHMAASYFIDYSAADVKTFVKTYRSLFNAEPNQFAFSGYDTVHYFVGMCDKYGKHWPEVLSAQSGSGLQTSFGFNRQIGNGNVNTAVRRIIYKPDFTTETVKK